MPETVGNEEDKAFEAWLVRFYREHPVFPDDLPDERDRQRWLMRYAFGAGMERGLEKRGCLDPNCGECKRDEA